MAVIDCLIRSKQTMVMMAGGYVAQMAYQSEISAKVVTLIDLQLIKLIAEQRAKLPTPAK